MPDIVIDIRGLRCPVSTMKMKRALGALGVGSTARIHSSDTSEESRTDAMALFQRMKLDLVGIEPDDGFSTYVVVRRI